MDLPLTPKSVIFTKASFKRFDQGELSMANLNLQERKKLSMESITFAKEELEFKEIPRTTLFHVEPVVA